MIKEAVARVTVDPAQVMTSQHVPYRGRGNTFRENPPGRKTLVEGQHAVEAQGANARRRTTARR